MCIFKKNEFFSGSFLFYIKRLFRILPVFWLAILFNVFILNNIYGDEKLLLNLTLLFSFFAHDSYIATGAWSIGNEVVYYFLTPLVIFVFMRNKCLVTFLSVFLLVYYSSFLSTASKLSEQWSLYIYPLNNLFFYLVGFLVFYAVSEFSVKERKLTNIVGFLSLCMCVLYLMLKPVTGDQVNIVSGFNRIVLSVLSVLVVYFVAQFDFSESNVTRMLNRLGAYSYGIYLIHPLVYGVLVKFNIINDGYWQVTLIVLLTLLASSITYHCLEKPFISLGGKFLKEKEKKYAE